jgi:hypothetical protein
MPMFVPVGLGILGILVAAAIVWGVAGAVRAVRRRRL